MTEKSYSAEEKLAAWKNADNMPGADPAKTRVDNVNNAGVVIQWAHFESDKEGAWTIDGQGRARGKGYKRQEILHAVAQQAHTEADANRQREIESYKKAAKEAGIPGAWNLFERIATLEAAVRRLQER